MRKPFFAVVIVVMLLLVLPLSACTQPDTANEPEAAQSSSPAQPTPAPTPKEEPRIKEVDSYPFAFDFDGDGEDETVSLAAGDGDGISVLTVSQKGNEYTAEIDCAAELLECYAGDTEPDDGSIELLVSGGSSVAESKTYYYRLTDSGLEMVEAVPGVITICGDYAKVSAVIDILGYQYEATCSYDLTETELYSNMGYEITESENNHAFTLKEDIMAFWPGETVSNDETGEVGIVEADMFELEAGTQLEPTACSKYCLRVYALGRNFQLDIGGSRDIWQMEGDSEWIIEDMPASYWFGE